MDPRVKPAGDSGGCRRRSAHIRRPLRPRALRRASPYYAPPSLRQVEIADAVVGGRAEPHAPLVVEEEVAHGVLRARHWIFRHLAGGRIEPADDVHVFGRVSDLVLAIDAERV